MASNGGDGATQALARLAVRVGPDAGNEFPVRQPVVSLGRGSQNDVVLPDDSVSTIHARLEYALGAWRITDLGSTNGTAVDGVRLAPNVPTPLTPGTTLRLGGVQLDFAPEAEADPEGARAGYRPPPPPPRVADRASGFRLPVWVLALILLVLAIAVFVFNLTRDEPVPEPAPVVAPSAGAAAPPPAPL